MSKVVRVQDGDYKLLVGYNSTGNIVLDTNPKGVVGAVGKVTIKGDLDVIGNVTAIESSELVITDNRITLNYGELGNGVSTLGPTAGIDIDRGTRNNVSVLWDERLQQFVFVDSTYANVEDLPTAIQGIAVNVINTGGEDLALITTGSGVITVTGTADYENRIIDYSKLNVLFDVETISRLDNKAIVRLFEVHGLQDNDRIDIICFADNSFNETFIPVIVIDDHTIQYDNFGSNVGTITFPPGLGGTVRPNAILDDDRIPNMKAVADYAKAEVSSYTPNKIQEQDTKVQTYDTDISGTSEITFDVDGNQRAVINNSGLYVDNVNVFGNSISNFLSDNLRVDSSLSLQNKAIDPTAIPGYVTLYSKSDPGTGGTGIFFVDPVGTNDELISKTKALLYSLIL